MSHFAVLVIGDDIEKQLQPYHEYECTGINDEYVIDVDITDKVLATMAEPSNDEDEEGSSAAKPDPLGWALDWHGLDRAKIVSRLEDVDRDGRHKYGFALVEDGKLIKAVDRTNPNKKWDWWVEGGRWSGYLKLKQGVDAITPCKSKPGYADSCRWGDVDIEGMREETRAEANALFDAWEAVHTKHPRIEAWPDVLARMGDVEAARAFYNSQPCVLAAQKARVGGVFGDVSKFGYDRDAYVQKAVSGAITTFAVVQNGDWRERGRRGWFACVTNEKDPAEWDREFAKLLDALDPDTRVTVVDCHI